MPDLAGAKIAYFGYCGPIDSAGATRIASSINAAVNEQFDSVHLCFSSVGGYVADGIYLYHYLRGLPISVTLHNTGTVASIATTVFVAGERRLCCHHAIFMMHPITMPANGSMASELLRTALDAAQRDEARTESILWERASIPEDILDNRRTREVYLTAQDALKYGLVREIVDFALPPGNKIFQI